MARRPGRLETVVTLALAAGLVAIIGWRFSDPAWVAGLMGAQEAVPSAPIAVPARTGTQEPEQPGIRGIPPDGFSIVVMWIEGKKPQLRHFVLPLEQVRARVAEGALGPMLEQLPDTPLKDVRYGVYRTADAGAVTPEAQDAATAGGNRCVLVLTEPVIQTLGGPQSAVSAVREQLPAALRCEPQEGGSR